MDFDKDFISRVSSGNIKGLSEMIQEKIYARVNELIDEKKKEVSKTIVSEEESEDLQERAPTRKIVVRNGKRTVRLACAKGYVKIRGKRSCRKVGASEKVKKRRTGIKAARKKKVRRAATNRKRAKSNKRRKGLGLK